MLFNKATQVDVACISIPHCVSNDTTNGETTKVARIDPLACYTPCLICMEAAARKMTIASSTYLLVAPLVHDVTRICEHTPMTTDTNNTPRCCCFGGQKQTDINSRFSPVL